MMVNQGGAEGGLESCGTAVPDLVIVQDASGEPLRTALGASYNSILIVDQKGVLAHHIAGAQFPAAAEEIATVVGQLL